MPKELKTLTRSQKAGKYHYNTLDQLSRETHSSLQGQELGAQTKVFLVIS